jgi:hypothetical protein
LLEHHSTPVIELVDRIALAVRNDLSVRRRAPPSKVAFCQNQSIRARQVAELLPADRQLPRRVAVAGSLLGDGLIEAQRGRAAAVSEEHDLAHAALALQELDAGLDVEGDVLPQHRRLVVVEARVHGEDEEAAARQLARGGRPCARTAGTDAAVATKKIARMRPARTLFVRRRRHRERQQVGGLLRGQGVDKSLRHH